MNRGERRRAVSRGSGVLISARTLLRTAPFYSTLALVTARKVDVVAKGGSRDWKFYATWAQRCVREEEREGETERSVILCWRNGGA